MTGDQQVITHDEDFEKLSGVAESAPKNSAEVDDEQGFNRRAILRSCAITGAGLICGAGAFAGSSSARVPDTDTPNENVDSTYVHSFPGFDQTIPPGEWILHWLPWLIVPEEDVAGFPEYIETRAWIDGEPVEDADDYWIGPLSKDEWTIDYNDVEFEWSEVFEWNYTTPPKDIGVHEYQIEFEFLETTPSGMWKKGTVLDTGGGPGTYTVEKAAEE